MRKKVDQWLPKAGDKRIVGKWLKDIRFPLQCDENVLKWNVMMIAQL